MDQPKIPTDPPILFIKPGAISKRDKAALRAAGVFVVEVQNPAEMKFVRAHTELSAGQLLGAALRAVVESQNAYYSKQKFADLVVAAFLAGPQTDVAGRE